MNGFGLGFAFTASDTASGVMDRLQGKLEQLHGGAKQMPEALKRAFGQFATGAVMATAGIATMAAFDPAIEAAAKFQKGIAEVGTMVDKSTFPISEMNRITKEMGATYGGEMSTQVKALYQAVSSGASNGAKATQILSAANELAIAGVTDQETALLGLTKVLNNYNMDWSKASDVSDAFFTAVKGGQTTVGQLGTYIGDLAAGAKSSGISMDELIGALGTGATLMRDTGAAATGLKAMLSGVAHPTADAAKEAKNLGITFDSATLRSKGLIGFLESIITSGKFSADTFTRLFGSVEASNAMTALTANNMGSLRDMMDAMSKKSGAARGAFDDMSSTMEHQKQVLANLKEQALIAVGEGLLPLTTGVTKAANTVLKAFTQIPLPIRQFIVTLVAGGAAVLTIVGTAIMAKAAFSLLAPAIGFGITVLKGLAVAALPAIAILGALAVVVNGFRLAFAQNIGGFGEFGRSITASAKLTIEALTQIFSQGGFSGAVREELNKAENAGIRNFAISVFLWVNRIKNFFTGLSEGFASGISKLGPVFEQFVGAIQRLGEAFGFLGGANDPAKAASKFAAFGTAGAATGEILAQAFSRFVNLLTLTINTTTSLVNGFKAFGSYVTDAFASVGPAFMFAANSLMALLVQLGLVDASAASATGVFGMLATVIAKSISLTLAAVGYVLAGIFAVVGGVLRVAQYVVVAVQAIATGLVALVRGIGSAVTGAISWISSAISAVGAFFTSMAVGIQTAIANVITAVVTYIGTKIAQIAEFFSPLTSRISTILGILSSTASTILGLIGQYLAQKFASAVAAVSAKVDEIKAAIQTKLNELIGIATSIFSAVRDAIQAKIDEIKAAIQSVADEAQAFFQPYVDAAQAKFNEIVGVVQGWVASVQSQASEFGNSVRASIDEAINAGSSYVTKFTEMGSNLVRGMVDGILKGLDWIADAARQLGDKAIQATKNVLQQHSPSRVFMDIGANTTQGFIEGIQAPEGQLRDTAKSTFADVTARQASNAPAIAAAQAQSAPTDNSQLTALLSQLVANAGAGGGETMRPIYLVVDGQVLARVVNQTNQSNAAESFQPLPSPV